MAYKALDSKCEDRGNWARSTGCRYIWKVEIEGEGEMCIELICEFFMNKRAIVVNNRVLFDGHKPYFKGFSHTFNIGKHVISVTNTKKETDLIINSISFKKLFTQRISGRMYGQFESEAKFDRPAVQSKLNSNLTPEYLADDEFFATPKQSIASDPFSAPIIHSDHPQAANYDFNSVFK